MTTSVSLWKKFFKIYFNKKETRRILWRGRAADFIGREYN